MTKPWLDSRSAPIPGRSHHAPPLFANVKGWDMGCGHWVILFQLEDPFDFEGLMQIYDFGRAADSVNKDIGRPKEIPRFFVGNLSKTGGLYEIHLSVFAPARPSRRVFGDPIKGSLLGWVRFARLVQNESYIP